MRYRKIFFYILLLAIAGSLYAVDRSNELIRAARAGTLTGHEIEVWRTLDPNLKGDMALVYAAQANHVNTIKLLLSIPNFADPAAYDSLAFRWATENGNLNVALLLLSKGAQLHALYDQALKNFVVKNQEEAIRVLLNLSLAIRSPFPLKLINRLLTQLGNSHPTITELLTQYKSTFNRRLLGNLFSTVEQAINAQQLTPTIIEQAQPPRLDPTSFITLLNRGLWSAVFHNNIGAIDLLVPYGADIHAEAETAIILALGMEHIEAVQRLLYWSLQPSQHAFDIQFITQWLATTTNATLRQMLEQYLLPVTEKLRKEFITDQLEGAIKNKSLTLNLIGYLATHYGLTYDNLNRALIDAILENNIDALNLLVQSGANIHSSSDMPLITAIQLNRVEATQRLLELSFLPTQQHYSAALITNFYEISNNETIKDLLNKYFSALTST